MANIDTMIELARETMNRAYAPYSKYYVGACVEAEDGTLFSGCNVENASYGLTVCAEVNAIGSLIAAGKKRIKSLLVISSGATISAPCGRCRQVIREFAAPNTPVYLCLKDKLGATMTVGEMLPQSFGPEHLE